MPPEKDAILQPPESQVLTLYGVCSPEPARTCRYCGREYPRSWEIHLHNRGLSIEHFTGLLDVLSPPGAIIEGIPEGYRSFACPCQANAEDQEYAAPEDPCECGCPHCCQG